MCSDLPLPFVAVFRKLDEEHPLCGLKTKNPYISTIYKDFSFLCAFLSCASRVEEGARTLDLRNHNPTL